jgi:hypothetical protein
MGNQEAPVLEMEEGAPSPVPPAPPSRLFGLSILLSSFLLFQLELIVAKHILPWFGGSPAVWTTCLLFFQGALLAGYAFADWSSSHLSLRLQGKLQFSVITVALLLFVLAVLIWQSPLTPGGFLRQIRVGNPVGHILLVLTLSVGTPFFLLSTTTPLLQNWFRIGTEDKSPYRLYALSNIGSLFGLLSYPFLLEWLLNLRNQARLWNLIFAVFLAVYALICRRIMLQPATEMSSTLKISDRPSWRMRAVWASLASCGSIMLLATTNLLCEDVAVTPFLWVLPLCLYLLSFILCFDHPRWYRRWIFYPLYGAAIWAVVWIFHRGIAVDLVLRSDVFLFVLFVACMVCHGELARSKPLPSQLTSFYLMVSFGGVLGGMLVTLVAPRVFTRYWEYHIGLIACGALALCALVVRRSRLLRRGLRWKVSLAATLLLIASAGVYSAARQQAAGRFFVRNFFGVKQVYDHEGVRYLQNGGVVHGAQNLDPARRDEPLAYYSHHSPVGKLLMNYPHPQGCGRRIGILGLGTGVLSVYGRPGDTMRFWEIDPQVIQLAGGPMAKFYYLQDAKANVELIQADGRLAIDGDKQSRYDILVIDGFSGDAIPTQLITREAFELYVSRLSGSDSVLIFHISNRLVDLTPVMLAFSRTEHIPMRFFMSSTSEYAAFSRNAAMLDLIGPDQKDYPWDRVESVLWTDSYSSLIPVLRH